MKFYALILTLIVMAAVISEANTAPGKQEVKIARCFLARPSQIARIVVTPSETFVDWNIKELATVSKEGGNTTRFSAYEDVVKWQVYLQNSVTDGSEYIIVLTPKTVSFQLVSMMT